MRRLDLGDTLGVHNAGSRQLFRRFLLGRRKIEAAFIQALQDGSCRDFHSFTRLTLDLFHQLGRDAPAPAGG